MKARLVPVYFEPGRDSGFDKQMETLACLLAEHAELLPPVPLGAALPQADAVVFPQLLGEAYRRLGHFQVIDRPILIVTSEFGTLSMWDWEIISYLRSEGVDTIAPYNLRQTQAVCNALRVKRELQDSKFLVYQDNPGEGAQASIFKRFYWWEDECSQRMKEKFGLTVVKKSLRELGTRAKAISDHEAQQVASQRPVPTHDLSDRALHNACKLYLAIKRDLDQDPAIRAVGMNCLNESHFLDTTPCLAWNLLYDDKRFVWGCEGDTMAMLTQYLLYHCLNVPMMMSNLYPFLLGDAALKHERISNFPEVDKPEDHILVAHCGYMGLMPKAFASQWTLRKKVLAIVDEHASAIDAQWPTGEVTMAKLHPTMREMTVAEGQLTGYAQYSNSDCVNGAVVRVRNGHKLMEALCSHHYLFTRGHTLADIQMLCKVFDLRIHEI